MRIPLQSFIPRAPRANTAIAVHSLSIHTYPPNLRISGAQLPSMNPASFKPNYSPPALSMAAELETPAATTTPSPEKPTEAIAQQDELPQSISANQSPQSNFIEDDMSYFSALINSGLIPDQPSPTASPPSPSPALAHSTSISPSLSPLDSASTSTIPPTPSRQWTKKPRKLQPNRKRLMEELRPIYKPEYYFEDGLRRVVPYNYTYNTFVKQRWWGKNLLEVFLSEFRDRPEEYYKKAIESGQVLINFKTPSTLDTVVKNGDIISHTLHRHEPPVTDKPIGIVYEDENMIVINKPPGVPVHPAGRYNFNSVVEIMRFERDGFNPLPCNRLDRLTSGLMFIAKTPAAADTMMTQLRTRTIKKTYLARVIGLFPSGETLCTQPILSISPKLGLNRVRADGKSARTVFRRLRYNPEQNYSIVECLPLTGRTHQIRVHLQWLGHPITNDPIYSNLKVWGVDLGKGGVGEDEDIITRLSRMGKDEVAAAWDYFNEMVKDYEEAKAEKMTGEVCQICQAPLYSDPGRHELGIYLHAKRYECIDGGWKYETEDPEWAREGVVNEEVQKGELGEEVGVLKELMESRVVVGDEV